MPIFQSPFSPAYWHTAAQEMKNYRSLVFSALMIAACIVLSHCTIRVGEGLSVSVTFLARALCSLVCGPVMVILFGAAEDTLSFFLSSGGYPYFPGYMLTTISGCLIYALFFYRARITWRRIILAKLITNVQNVLLGSLWSAILYSKGYLYYMTTSAVKNALYLPLQILLLGFLFQAILPALQKQGNRISGPKCSSRSAMPASSRSRSRRIISCSKPSPPLGVGFYSIIHDETEKPTENFAEYILRPPGGAA